MICSWFNACFCVPLCLGCVLLIAVLDGEEAAALDEFLGNRVDVLLGSI
jgi:hypothetical protein